MTFWPLARVASAKAKASLRCIARAILTNEFVAAMSPSLLNLAARNLARHRTRTLISLSSIAFGAIALLLAGGFIEWIFSAMRESAIQTGLGHIQITRPGFRDAGLADP